MSNHPLVVHCRRAEFDVYVGRPSSWGNPFSHLPNTQAKWKVSTREEAVSKFREYLLNSPSLMSQLPELKGKRLGCWCHPKSCHASILAEIANPESTLFTDVEGHTTVTSGTSKMLVNLADIS